MRCVCGFEGDGLEYAAHLIECQAKPGEKWDFYITNDVDQPVNEVGRISEVLEVDNEA